MCDQALENTELSLTCSAGEIGFVKAVYSTYDAQEAARVPSVTRSLRVQDSVEEMLMDRFARRTERVLS